MRQTGLTEFKEYCAICGFPTQCVHHLVFGNAMREKAEQDGLTLPLCNKCHNMGAVNERIHDNSAAESLSKMLGQVAWESDYILSLIENIDDTEKRRIKREARNRFQKRYGRSYL